MDDIYDTYTLDELILKLENIKDGLDEPLNLPKSIYTLALEIKRIKELNEKL